MRVESGKWKVESVTRKFLRNSALRNRTSRNRLFTLLTLLFTLHSSLFTLSAQNVVPRPGERIFVKGRIAEIAVENRAMVNLGEMTPDSLYRYMAAIDSLRSDGVRFDRTRIDSLVTSLIDRSSPTGDSLTPEQVAGLVIERKALTLNTSTVRRFMDDARFITRYIDGGADTLIPRIVPPDTLSKREKRRLMRQDTTVYRHSTIFRDSMKLSPVIAISMVAPGFSQLYNRQYWKIPVLYGTVGAGMGLWAWQSKEYRPYRERYDALFSRPVKQGESGYEEYRSELIDVQTNMIRHNTNRQLALGFSIASYMYFLADGTLNYPGTVDHVKKATTLSTVLPGAGQVYNKTYWKLPVVIGGGAALVYVINWNNRGYQRFLRAYNDWIDDDNNTLVEEGLLSMGLEGVTNMKNGYRRSRDLAIILTGLFYVIQIVDAHATAHMKTYDVSDDLSRVTFGPSMDGFYSHRLGGNVNSFGVSLNLRF